MSRRFLAVLRARNLEFIRDRSSFGWNILLPVLLVLGLGFIFSGGGRSIYKIAVLDAPAAPSHPFLATEYIDFVEVTDRDAAIAKLSRHQYDMLVDFSSQPKYWINADAPKGYFLEKVLNSYASPGGGFERGEVTGKQIRYIDWLLPGILGMNMMFSCLFGVGYVVVRYRKNGFLKRLQATPLRTIEFMSAQVCSRLMLIMFVTAFVYVGTKYLIGFKSEGSDLLLFGVAALGAVSMIALSLIVAARINSEELAGGLLNMITWPMMLMSGVWFSMEGMNPVMQQAANAFPLTHLLDAARAIMLDGAGTMDVAPQIATLGVMTIVFLAIGSLLFRWQPDA